METLDLESFLKRFKERALAVKNRNLPPVAGEERKKFIDQAQLDFQDFSIIADSEVSFDEGILTLKVDLGPKD